MSSTTVLLTIAGLHMAWGMSSFPLIIENFSSREMAHVEGLRDIVKNDLPNEYMSSDTFIARWLKEKDFNFESAEELLRENLRWRQLEQIDSILHEEWEDMNVRFPYSRISEDKNGRPVVCINLGEWDIASYLTEAPDRASRLGRYFVKMMEESENYLRTLQGQGKNVTQFNLLVNMKDYSNNKHACIQCFYFYRNVGDLLSSNYPYSTERNIFVNVPYLFKAAFNFLPYSSRSVINMFGQDQVTWENELRNVLDEEKFPAGLIDKNVHEKDNTEGFLFWNIEL